MRDKELRPILKEFRELKRELIGYDEGSYMYPTNYSILGKINNLIKEIKENQKLIMDHFKLIRIEEPSKVYLTIKEEYQKQPERS
jgi:alpha-D-ribose 1-methylphosphonate 5-triphosphate diphosphatase PhnM